MPFADVAFAAGFASIRQFNDTIREVYAATPTELRGRDGAAARPDPTPGQLELRLPVRAPYAGARGARASSPPTWCRAWRRAARTGTPARCALPHGPGTSGSAFPTTTPRRGTIRALPARASSDLRDVGAAVERCRRLLDADCDPVAVDGRALRRPADGPAGAAATGAAGAGRTSTATRSRSAP